jgi:DNA-binding transcriptional MerR regulator
MLTIQQASELTGMSVHTLRYYERIQLLTAIERAANGHRRYHKRDMERLMFLNYMRLTGMPLTQLRQYSLLHDQGDEGIPDRIAMLQGHRAKVARQIEELTDMLRVIDYKLGILGQQCMNGSEVAR